MQDSAVLEVGDFGVGVNSAHNSEGFSTVGGDRDVLRNLQVTSVDVNVELLRASKAEGVSVFAFLELEGQDTHTKEVTSVDALVGLSDNDLNTLEVGAFSSPIARGTRSVLFTSEDDGVNTSRLVLISSVKDSHLFSGRDVDGSGTSLGHHLVDETHVSESTSSHNLIVTSARSVRVEVFIGDSALSKEASSRGVLGDFTSGRDVIGGDGVTHVQEAVSVVDARDGLEFSLSALEERRVVDVGGVIIPRVEFTFRGLEVLPHLGSLKNVVVNVNEHLRLDASFGNGLNFITSRPDIGEENVFAFLVLTDRLGLEIVVNGTSKGVSNDKRRRGQVVGSSVRMNSALEVSVSGKDGGSNHIVVDDGVLDLVGDISRVSNAGHATISSGRETKVF